jgi:hypothetical protein
MFFQSIEVRRPELPVRRQPRVEVGQRLGADPVDAALRVDARLHEAGVLEDAQVLRHGGLAEPQVTDEFADRSLAVAKRVEDRDAPWFRQNLKCSEFRH